MKEITVMAPTAKMFQAELDRLFNQAISDGKSYIDVRSGPFHREVGGYPGRDNRMPVLCGVLYKNIGPDDSCLSRPPSGLGATLEVRYVLPRP